MDGHAEQMERINARREAEKAGPMTKAQGTKIIVLLCVMLILDMLRALLSVQLH